MAARTVGEIFSKEYVKVPESELLSRCLEFFKKGRFPALAVVDGKDKYRGVLAERWIRRSGLDPSTTKVQALMRSAPKMEPQDSISKAARLMIESDIRQLPVFKGDTLLGFVTDEQVIHSAVLDKWGETEVSRVMTPKPYLVEEDETIGFVLDLFRDHDISHAPVMNKGRLVGVVSVIDFIEHLFKPLERPRKSGFTVERLKTLGGPVKEIMSSPPITVAPETTMREAEQIMHKNDIHSLVVVVQGYPIGIVTKRDFLEPLAQVEMADKGINVQFATKEVQLDETEKEYLLNDFKSFAEKYRPILESGTLFVYMKTHGASHKGEQLIHIRLQLRTRKGNFFSASDGYSLDQTFHLALDHLERQFLKSKDFEQDKDQTSKYFRRIRFPLSEL